MKFEEALHNFRTELAKEYGPCGDITKIGLPTDLFERVVVELKSMMRYGSRTDIAQMDFRLRDIGELHCMGVQILRRDKDTF